MGQAVVGLAVLSTKARGKSTGRRGPSHTDSVLEYPHPALERPSFEVDPSAPEIVELAAALVGTMRCTPDCFSLSAPQLGHHGRVLCVDVTGHEHVQSRAGLILLANPELWTASGRIFMREECASCPRVIADVERPGRIVIAGTVPGRGRKEVILADGFEARCLLHELDHLDGISMLDRVTDPIAHVHERERR
jgi:peptide deformylase